METLRRAVAVLPCIALLLLYVPTASPVRYSLPVGPSQQLPYPFSAPVPARPPRPPQYAQPSFRQVSSPPRQPSYVSLADPGPDNQRPALEVDYPRPALPHSVAARIHTPSHEELVRQRFSRTFLSPFLHQGPQEQPADMWMNAVEQNRRAQKQVMKERQQESVHRLFQKSYPNLPVDEATGRPMQFRALAGPNSVTQMGADANYRQPDRTIPAAQGAAGQRVSNPFIDRQAETPRYEAPAYINRPFDVYKIPEMTDRFYTEFIWNKKLGGKWYYDYDKRITKIEYMIDGGTSPGSFGNRPHVKGYFFNYDFLNSFLIKYDYGSGAGETCYRLSLPPQFARMFSPRTWRRINVDDIEEEEADIMESHRQSTEVYMNGNWNNTKISYAAYTNGTLRRISIGPDTWEFQNFQDLSELDNYAAKSNQYLLHNAPPELPCNFDGPLVEDERKIVQKHIPFPLTKPYQGKRDTKYDEAMAQKMAAGSGG